MAIHGENKIIVSGWLLACSILFLVSACKPADPQPGLLVGPWKQTAYKNDTDSNWQTVVRSRVVVFGANGKIDQPDDQVLPGGWCNTAERYTVTNDRLVFEFGPVNCIPFVDPKIPNEAKIVRLTSEELILQWGRNGLTFTRMR